MMRRVLGAPARRIALAASLLAVGGSMPWWGTRALSTLAFFRVRSVEVQGAHYLAPRAVVERLGLDTSMSVWRDLSPLEARVRTMAGVRDAVVSRALPGTIVVRLVERTPVALAPSGGGLRPYDGTGTLLPIDPTRDDLDVPIVATADAATLRLVGRLRQRVPAFYATVSEVRRTSGGDLLFLTPGLRVLAAPGTNADRFATILPVAADLARRHVRVQELDLRFRDQVVARLQ